MEKILTVSVAAYNVEKYLENCLSSLVADEVMEDIEVLVIDDGGKDASLEIAKEYEKKFPDTFHAIHKENGGYGSTVNYSVEHATGKYFKLLDGDDWFITEDLKRLVEFLKTSNTDVIINEYFLCKDKEATEVTHGKNEKDGVLEISSLYENEGIGMPALTFKTEILRQCGLKLPHHMLYTDQFYSTVPFSVAQTIQFVRYPIYCYRLGYETQSMSRASRVKNTENWIKVCDLSLEFCREMKEKDCKNYKYILMQTSRCYCGTVKTLLMNPLNKNNLLRIKEYEQEVKIKNIDVYNYATKIGKMGKALYVLRKSHYSLYWFIDLVPKTLMH